MIIETRQPAQVNLPHQRWQIHPQDLGRAKRIAQATQLSPLLAQVLLNRGLVTLDAVQFFLAPESQTLPAPLTEFPDLAASLELLETAIHQGHKIAICGDYDADGMTSTALLLRALKALGAHIDYAIPSRMHEGYGINERIVEDFAAEGVKVILTVDNGIAAHDPVAKARALGLNVIITDHHDLPPQLPPANAILNPKLLPKDSLYSGLAGVGVAYILAVALAQQMGQTQQLVTPLLELFTLGTIADLAPLIGVNRRWLQRGLKRLPYSEFAGVKALIQVAGSASSTKQAFKPETIGFRLGPRINAVGRIGNPQTVIELLTTDDQDIAQARAAECELANQQRQQMCREIEMRAIALIETNTDGTLDPSTQCVLVLIAPNWHHGVIGVVASRLVERYGVPVFIGTYEDESQTLIRGSARSIPEFDVFDALYYCGDLLSKFGGHRAAGGFTLAAANLALLRSRLSEFAHQHLKPEHLKPLITIDAQVQFTDITPTLYQEMDQLQPCGIGNPEPVFWSRHIKVLDQRLIGQNHLKVTLSQETQTTEGGSVTFTAIAWRWAEYYPLPERIDVAYRLRENTWNGETALELELVGVRPTTATTDRALTQPATTAAALGPKPSGRSPLLPKVDLQIICPDPPKRAPAGIEWHTLEELKGLFPQLSGNVLLYGYQRPYLSAQDLAGALIYDRPRGHCATVLLWTLPPSWTHLRWLLALAQPQRVYVRNSLPKQLDAETLRSRLSFEIVKQPTAVLNLLDLGQQWWVAPSTLVAALREMEYPCPSFGATASLEQELQRLQRWYHCPAQRLATLP